MPLINYKGELKRKWTKYFGFFSPAGADDVNGNDDDNDNIFVMKDTQLYVSAVTLTARAIKNNQNVSTKYLKDPFIGMNIKRKVRIKLNLIQIHIEFDLFNL